MEVLPIRPFRYNPKLSEKIDDLTAPLFDVVSGNQRRHLYQNPLNSIHLSVPNGTTMRAAEILEQWKRHGIICQDELPGIYVYYQYFQLPGEKRTYCRKGFVCHVRVHEWSDKMILRHENTIPDAVNDRIDLLEKTALHSSPTHGLYSDPQFQLEPYMDEAITNPLIETEDYQGVRDVLAVIHDAAVIRKFLDVIGPLPIILADGHHRYEGSIMFRRKMLEQFPDGQRMGFNYHLMYLTNSESSDIRILPTHRIIRNLPDFNEPEIVEKFHDDFIVKPVDDIDTLNEIIAGKPWAFGVMMKGMYFKARLKPESFGKMTWRFPDIVKKLDLTVMHYFIIEKILGIPGKIQRSSAHIDFDRSYADCVKKVVEGEAQMAIITNEISIDDVKQVCMSGYTLPQKSTYFYPKVISGFLFTSILEPEFAEPDYSPFY